MFVTPRNPYSTGRISAVDLLVLISSDLMDYKCIIALAVALASDDNDSDAPNCGITH
jgi:hypothetical protein